MKLADFAPLIAGLPVDNQAFRSKRDTWHRFDSDVRVGPVLNRIFGQHDEVFISRSDLRNLASAADLVPFVMTTIIWGYPRGGRGNNIQMAISRIDDLAACLSGARAKGIDDWCMHSRASRIAGVGLSTYTKFLHFLDVTVAGVPALILDRRVGIVLNRRLFTELAALGDVRWGNFVDYPRYLHEMRTVAAKLKVTPASLELFLFVFGENLKPPAME